MDPPLHEAGDMSWFGAKLAELTDMPLEILDLHIFSIDHNLEFDEWQSKGQR